MALLYPTLDYQNKFHQDHIFPQSLMTKRKLKSRGISDQDVEFFVEHLHALPNLQLLAGVPNQEKSDAQFADWFEERCPTSAKKAAFKEQHYIPDVDLGLENFRAFFESRKQLLRAKLEEVLSV